MAAQIAARGLRKSYLAGTVPVDALRGVDFEVQPGELVAVCGPSGSGKSTLLHVLAGFDRPDQGEVVIEGEKLDWNDERRRARLLSTRIGFVFQSFNLVPVLSAVENVELPLWPTSLPPAERRGRALGMLERVGLAARKDHRPGELSGGQQQRVAVARALVGQPVVVFADEPTANLDSHTAEELMGLMKELNQGLGTTFVFSTHDERAMGFASRIVRMQDGAVIG